MCFWEKLQEAMLLAAMFCFSDSTLRTLQAENKVTYLFLIGPDWAERRVYCCWLVSQSILPSPSSFLAACVGKELHSELCRALSWMRRSWAAMTGCQRGVKLRPRFLHEPLSWRREKILLIHLAELLTVINTAREEDAARDQLGPEQEKKLHGVLMWQTMTDYLVNNECKRNLFLK